MPQSSDSVVFRTIVYSFGAIIGGWGSFEILLRVDPFAAMWVRGFVFPGLAIAVTAVILIALHVVPTTLKSPGGRINTLIGCVLVGTIVAAAPGLHHGGWRLWSDWLLVAVGFSIAFAGLVAAYIYDHAKLTDTGRAWPTWLEVPMLIAAMFLGIMIVFVASGRAKNLTIGDIAQEELRQGGLDFSTSSLQEAMFLISPRSVELFRKANVDDSDIREALGVQTPYTGDDPLVTSLLERVDGDNELRCLPRPAEGSDDQRSCQRIDDFVRLLQREASPQQEAGTLAKLEDMWKGFRTTPNFVQPLCFSDIPASYSTESLCENLRAPIPLRIPDGTPSRPLLSHAIAGGHANVAACIVALCGPPDPTADLEPAIAQDTPSDLAQRYAHFVLDPHLAIDQGASIDDGRWTEDEAEYLKTVLCDGRGEAGYDGMSPLPVNLYRVDPTPECVGRSTHKYRSVIHVPDVAPAGALVRLNDTECWISQVRSDFYSRVVNLYNINRTPQIDANKDVDVKIENFVGKFQIGGFEQPFPAVLQRRESGDIRFFSLGLPDIEGQARLEAHGWGVRSDAGVWSLRGQNSSLIVGYPDAFTGSFAQAAAKPPTTEQRLVTLEPESFGVGAGANYQSGPLTVSGPSKIRITGRANNDTCFYFAPTERSKPQSRFIRSGEEVAFEAGPFGRGTIDLRVAALSADDGASTFQISAQPTLLCEALDVEQIGPIDPGVIDFGKPLAGFKSEAATGARYRCPIKSPVPTMVEITMESVIDAVVELHQPEANPELLQAVDGALTGAAEAPAVERLVAFLEKDVAYAIDARAYSGAFDETLLGVSLARFADLSPESLKSATQKAPEFNPNTTLQNGPFSGGEFSIYRVYENIQDIAFSFTSANIFSYSNQGVLIPITADSNINLQSGTHIVIVSWIDDNWITLSSIGTVDPSDGDRLEVGVQFMPELPTGVRSHYFVAPRDGYLTINMDDLAADLDLALWGSDEAPLSSSVNYDTEPDTVTAPVSAGQSYRLDVTAIGASAYTLKTRLD